MPNSPYSPDLAPNEFLLFSRMKSEPNVNARIRQRSVTEFLFKSGGISTTTIHSKLQPRWVQRSQKGDFDLHDKERLGKPSTVATDQNLALVEEIVKNNRTI
ncbi:hypothetical protein LAZ67_X003467 [Cordylochernes scorpioides]|uniref:Transposase n=1 Tax=Cordylochernes scorpioides TaxID=51811 RepID=A0ABY6LYA0_9ARAC|nr:hypothetical protein LAZ67_X003467 [Cordylochernes scorpioides]